jgi:hypothetical protein
MEDHKEANGTHIVQNASFSQDAYDANFKFTVIR